MGVGRWCLCEGPTLQNHISYSRIEMSSDGVNIFPKCVLCYFWYLLGLRNANILLQSWSHRMYHMVQSSVSFPCVYLPYRTVFRMIVVVRDEIYSLWRIVLFTMIRFLENRCLILASCEVKRKLKLPLCLTEHHVMKTYVEWKYSFTQRPFYPQEKCLRYPFHRRLGGPQSLSGHYNEDKSILSLHLSGI
jgi:hypothetical protein